MNRLKLYIKMLFIEPRNFIKNFLALFLRKIRNRKEKYEICGENDFIGGSIIKNLDFYTDKTEFLVKKMFPASTKKTIENAEKACNHIFNILGTGDTFLGKNIDWFSDFKGKSWPSFDYHEDLNEKLFRNNCKNPDYIGDIKIPWEFNKHKHFLDLGKAYFLTGHEEYAKEFVTQTDDWIDKNPYGQGINWFPALIVGQRVIYWILTLGLFAKSVYLKENFLTKVLKSIYEHGYYIFNHLEFGIKNSNHLIGNLSALLLLSITFPQFKEAEKWEKKSLKELENEIKKQVYPDGVDYEQSTSYHRYVLEFALLPLLFSKKEKLYKDKTLKRIEKMIEFTMNMLQPNGKVQPISDADGARVWDFNNAHINDHRSYLAIGAVLFNRPDFKYIAEDAVEELIWVLGEKGLEKFNSIRAEKPTYLSKAFPKGGYYVMRDSWDKNAAWLFFDCGQIGMGKWPNNTPIGLHGHNDILNFGLSYKGETIFTDKGSYTYTGDRILHNYSRSAYAHNVLIVDNQDMCEMSDAFWTTISRPTPEKIKWHEDKEKIFVEGAYTSHKKIKIHRKIEFNKKEKIFLITDSIETKGIHLLDNYFHLMPGIEVSKKENRFIISKGNAKIILELKEDFTGEIQDSWYSDDYGYKEKSKTIKISRKQACPCKINYILYLK